MTGVIDDTFAPRSAALFDFKQPGEWCCWKRRFEQFRLVSGLSSKGKELKICTLLYCMGEGAEDTLASTGIFSEDRIKYDAVMAKFDTFFNVRKMFFLSAPVLIIEDKETTNQLNSSLLVYITLQKAANMVNSKKRRYETGSLCPNLTLEKAKTMTQQ